MKKPVKKPKLDLSRETLRHLDARALREVGGGQTLRPYLPTTTSLCG